MKKVVIVAPHFPPSNLVGVHRSRLFSRHLPDFGWEPIIITVHHDHYEEALDWNLSRIVSDELRIERVGALATEPVRLVGDIGVRGFFPLLRRIVDVIDRERIDFIHIPIPTNYAALLGRIIYHLRNVPYGIDFMDPWVHDVRHPAEKMFNKHWLTRKLATILEPVAVKRAALITGVAPAYYEGVLERNPQIKVQAVSMAMGGEAGDHEWVRELKLEPYLFEKRDDTLDLVYAGAMLPKAYEPLEHILRAIAAHREAFGNVRFHFIGTGSSPDDPEGYNIRPLAEAHGLWQDLIFEHPARIPYLDALAHQEAADAIFILGSTQPHYTPSKVYQGILAGKPVFAVLHEASTARDVLQSTGAGKVLTFAGAADVKSIEETFANAFAAFRAFSVNFTPETVDRSQFEEYSARSVTRTLANAFDRVLSEKGTCASES